MDNKNRINTIVEKIAFKKIADIGTDHGYIAISAFIKKAPEKIIACDVNNAPLKNCHKNLFKYGLTNKIETRIGNGIEKLKKNEVETVIIAGMGGKLILDILKKDIVLTKTLNQIILQPQSAIPSVRKFIHEIGFSIFDEEIVFEDGIYYFILDCRNVIENSYKNDEYYTGKITKYKQAYLLKNYLTIEKQKLIKIKNNIIKNAKNIENEKINLRKIEHDLEIIDRALLEL